MQVLAGLGKSVAAISRATLLILLLVGGIQLLVTIWLGNAAWQSMHWQDRVVSLEQANHQYFDLGVTLLRENVTQLDVLLAAKPAEDKKLRLLTLQQQSLKVLDALRAAAESNPLLGGIAIRQELFYRGNLLAQQRKLLRGQATSEDENRLYAWRLAMSGLQDSVDKMLMASRTLQDEIPDRRVVLALQLRQQLLQFGRILTLEQDSLQQQLYFGRPINTTIQYQISKNRETAEVLLQALRQAAGTLEDDDLALRISNLAEQLWRVQRLSDGQLKIMQYSGAAQADAELQLQQLAARTDGLLADNFAYTQEVAARERTRMQDELRESIILQITLILLILLLNAGLYLFFRRRVFYPLLHMSAVLDACSDAILTVDKQGKILAANLGAARMLACQPAQLLRENVYRLLRTGSESDWLGKEDGEQQFAAMLNKLDGSSLLVSVSVSPLPSVGNGLSLLVVHDEDQLRRVERLQTRQLGLLTGIQGMEAMLLARKPRNVIYREMLHVFLDYLESRQGVIVALEKGREETSRFIVQARHCSGDNPEWIQRFCEMPVGMALKSGQQQMYSVENDWCYLFVEVEARTVMVAAVAMQGISEEALEVIRPLLVACGAIVSYYLEEDKRKSTERHLREQLKLDEMVFLAMPVATVQMNRMLLLTRGNSAAEALFHCGQDGLLDLPLRELLGRVPGWLELSAALMSLDASQDRLSRVLPLESAAGETRWYLLEAVLLLGQTDNPKIVMTFTQTGKSETTMPSDLTPSSRQTSVLTTDTFATKQIGKA